jgi:hypothetical protein
MKVELIAGLAKRLAPDLWPEIFVQIRIHSATRASDLPAMWIDARLDFVEGEHLTCDGHAA